jgi:hypothetical protein
MWFCSILMREDVFELPSRLQTLRLHSFFDGR